MMTLTPCRARQALIWTSVLPARVVQHSASYELHDVEELRMPPALLPMLKLLRF
jgi:hypothetical protein